MIFIFFIVFCATYLGVVIFGRWVKRRRIFDVPNERSSHTTPTPHGGGLIIVVVCLAAYTFSTLFWTGDFRWSYLLGAFLIALISWLDDLYTISFIWRFLIHSSAAALVIFNLGYFDETYIPFFGNFNLGGGGLLITFFWIVWLTNAYNFMDGIDGIAGMQAVTAGIGWLIFGTIFGFPASGFYGGVIACASLGFLMRNWQPAKIFMGDVGSAFLGYSFAVLPLLAKNEGGANSENQRILFPLAVLLIWLFVFDTLWTFGRRVLNGEKVWEAHRGHLYQKFVIRGFSHQFVSGLYGAISILNVLLAILFLENRNRETMGLFFILGQSGGLLIGLYFFRK
ncbi:MAG: glycosyltransferase family 4 protein [Pyrinomonadaceae bacterium]|nr:glycosyltransferase family 4 protein [Pyrinomonadaceae bacterium]